MRSIAIASGKGGVGKTSFVINLALALTQYHQKVLIFDADLGLANVDVMLGISPKFDIRYVINGELNLKEIVYSTEYDFDLIPASSGVVELTHLNSDQKILLKDQMEEVFKVKLTRTLQVCRYFRRRQDERLHVRPILRLRMR